MFLFLVFSLIKSNDITVNESIQSHINLNEYIPTLDAYQKFYNFIDKSKKAFDTFKVKPLKLQQIIFDLERAFNTHNQKEQDNIIDILKNDKSIFVLNYDFFNEYLNDLLKLFIFEDSEFIENKIKNLYIFLGIKIKKVQENTKLIRPNLDYNIIRDLKQLINDIIFYIKKIQNFYDFCQEKNENLFYFSFIILEDFIDIPLNRFISKTINQINNTINKPIKNQFDLVLQECLEKNTNYFADLYNLHLFETRNNPNPIFFNIKFDTIDKFFLKIYIKRSKLEIEADITFEKIKNEIIKLSEETKETNKKLRNKLDFHFGKEKTLKFIGNKFSCDLKDLTYLEKRIFYCIYLESICSFLIIKSNIEAWKIILSNFKGGNGLFCYVIKKPFALFYLNKLKSLEESMLIFNLIVADELDI